MFADHGSYADDPAAIGAIVSSPPVRAVDGGNRFQNSALIAGQARITGLLLFSGEFIAILEIAQLVFQQDEVDVHLQIFRCEVGEVKGDSVFPEFLFRRGKRNRGAGSLPKNGAGGFGCRRRADLWPIGARALRDTGNGED